MSHLKNLYEDQCLHNAASTGPPVAGSEALGPHPSSRIPVVMQLRHRMHLSGSCTCFIDWKINATPFISPSPLTTFSFSINVSFLQLSTGSEYFKISKSNVVVGKELRFCRLLMIKAPENANGHGRYFFLY